MNTILISKEFRTTFGAYGEFFMGFYMASKVPLDVIIPDFAESVLPDIAGNKIHGVIWTDSAIGEDIGSHPQALTAVTVGCGFEIEMRIPAANIIVVEIWKHTDVYR